MDRFEALSLIRACRTRDVARAISEGLDVSNPAFLAAAAQAGSMEIAQLLVEAGANVNGVDELCDQGALRMAVERGDLAMVNWLLGLGADPNLEDHEGDTPMSEACRYSSLNGGVEANMLTALLAHGGNLHHKVGEGTSLLMLAVQSSWWTTKFLIERGAGVDAVDGGGDTALRYAVEAGRPDTLGLLLDLGADPEKGGMEKPLDVARRMAEESEDMACVEILGVAVAKKREDALQSCIPQNRQAARSRM